MIQAESFLSFSSSKEEYSSSILKELPDQLNFQPLQSNMFLRDRSRCLFSVATLSKLSRGFVLNATPIAYHGFAVPRTRSFCLWQLYGIESVFLADEYPKAAAGRGQSRA